MPSVSAAESQQRSAELKPRFHLDAGDYVAALEVARDGLLCIAGLGNGRVLGIDLGTGKEAFSVRAHDDGVLRVSISPDGQNFATCGQDSVAKVWARDGSLICELPECGGSWVEHVGWAPVGGRLATAAGRKIRIWTDQGEPLVQSEQFASSITGLAWRSDGTGVAGCCYGGVHILPLVAGAKPRHLAWKGSLISVSWSPDTKVIACGSQDKSVHFWRLSSGRDSQMSGFPFKPQALAWARDSKQLATSGDATISVWDFRGKGPEGTRPRSLRGHRSVCTRLVFAPKQDTLASGSQDGSVLLWETRHGERPRRFAFLDDEVTGLAWDAKHDALVGSDASGTIRAWEIA
jgi:WD40 repeat protein